MKKRILSMLLACCLVTLMLPELSLSTSAYDMGKNGQSATVSAGDAHSAAITSDGSLWTWGYNDLGQLGNGGGGNSTYISYNPSNWELRKQPIQTVPEKILDNAVAVSAGEQHTAAIMADGTLWTWGSNWYCELGDGTYKASSIPVKVMDNAVAVSAGYQHTVAIKTDGTLWSWGNSGNGQLGDGTIGSGVHINGRFPIKIMDDVIAVSAGRSHTMAIKSDGTLWAWGLNSSGQLGVGTTENSAVPVKVMENVIAASAGCFHTVAITSDGSLWAWGSGYYLGNGTYETSTVPVKIMDDVIAVSAGHYHTAAIKSDGSLWAWGSGYSILPVKIMDDVVEVSAGTLYNLAITSDGTLWAWGDNEYGQLGNGGVGDDTKSVLYGNGSSLEYPIQTTPIKVMDNVALPEATTQPQENTPDRSQDELREMYIQQHINYYQTTYSNEIISMSSTIGLGMMLEDADGDLSDAFYRGLSIAVADGNMIASFLSPTSYMDIKWGNEMDFKFKIPDASILDLGSSEYSVILYQLMASDTVYNGIMDTFSINYNKNIRSFAKALSDNAVNLAKNANTTGFNDAKGALYEATEIIRTADPDSTEFAIAYENFESLVTQYYDLKLTKNYLNDISSVAGDAFSFMGAILNEIDSIGKAYQYVCWAESYAETSETFKDVLIALADEADERSNDLYIRSKFEYGDGGIGNPYSEINMCNGLSKAIHSYIKTMDTYARDAHEAFVNQVIEKTGDSSLSLVVTFLTSKALGGSICPELAAINAALSTGKLMIDLFTGIDDEYKLSLTVESLKLITELLKVVSDDYGNTLILQGATITFDGPAHVQFTSINPETQLIAFMTALKFDESIKMYKNAMRLACDYGIKYEQSKASSALLPEQISLYSTIISNLSYQKVLIDEIHCHDETLFSSLQTFNDISTNAYYYNAVLWAVANGVTSGTSQTTFSPNDTCTRGQAVTFLWRALGQPEPSSITNPFTDVRESDYFYIPVLWAVEKGITSGTSSTTFSPSQTCSTAHIITFIYRAFGIGNNGWYTEAAAWAEQEGLLTGTGVAVTPDENCSRANVVTFLYRKLG